MCSVSNTDLYQVNKISLLVCLFLLPLMLKFGGGHLVPAEVDVVQPRFLRNRNCNSQKHRDHQKMRIEPDMFVLLKTIIEIINN